MKFKIDIDHFPRDEWCWGWMGDWLTDARVAIRANALDSETYDLFRDDETCRAFYPNSDGLQRRIAKQANPDSLRLMAEELFKREPMHYDATTVGQCKPYIGQADVFDEDDKAMPAFEWPLSWTRFYLREDSKHFVGISERYSRAFKLYEHGVRAWSASRHLTIDLGQQSAEAISFLLMPVLVDPRETRGQIEDLATVDDRTGGWHDFKVAREDL